SDPPGSALRESDLDRARLAPPVVDRHRLTVSVTELCEEGKRIVIVDEEHCLARRQRIEGTEDRRVAEALRDASRVEGIDGLGREMPVRLLGHERLSLFA